ncbi:chymotrypsin inhibitor-like [Ceratina calcarata]|uniref:Chymotrypsin inhibitor-like n=1 Tax=Ceratina calcarata TaxID=156304 RepID=A0AAJ7J065_9HYME|nr:chymotrypsin inhibitor-like [Ceratina calcarata]
MQKFVLLFILLVVAYVSAESKTEMCKKLGNETWASCGAQCEPLCSEPGVKPDTCGELPCKGSCRCAKDYNRNSEGKCVLAKDC